MGLSTFPAVASPIKSIQRGVAAVAGNITITAVNVAKTVTRSFSTGSAGYVAATGTVAAANGSTSGISFSSATVNMSQLVVISPASYPPSGGATGYYYNYNTRYAASAGPYALPTASSSGTVGAFNTNGANVALNNQAISGGSTSLATETYGVYLSNSTTLVATGPCRYEVIEHY